MTTSNVNNGGKDSVCGRLSQAFQHAEITVLLSRRSGSSTRAAHTDNAFLFAAQQLLSSHMQALLGSMALPRRQQVHDSTVKVALHQRFGSFLFTSFQTLPRPHATVNIAPVPNSSSSSRCSQHSFKPTTRSTRRVFNYDVLPNQQLVHAEHKHTESALHVEMGCPPSGMQHAVLSSRTSSTQIAT